MHCFEPSFLVIPIIITMLNSVFCITCVCKMHFLGVGPPCVCHTSFVILLNHSMLNLRSFAFIFHQKPNQYQRYLEFSPVKGVKELVLITRMFLLSIVAVCIDDGHDCISTSSGIYTTTHE